MQKWACDLEHIPGLIFVDENATGNDDGTSWADAYNYLQDALLQAWSGDEVWVAQGLYKPHQARLYETWGRYNSFTLKKNLAMYGGFPSGGAGWEQRDPNLYETVLSGDLGATRSIHVVVVPAGVGPSAILDGFTITDGHADGHMGPPYPPFPVLNSAFGGGLICEGSPTLRNCIFENNRARTSGAAMYITDSTAKLTNCTFIDNTTDSGGSGGAVYWDYEDAAFIKCNFYNNSAREGGAARIYGPATFVNCVISGNRAYSDGGALWGGNCTLVNCILSGNAAGEKSGAFFSGGNRACVLINCTLAGNSTDSGDYGSAFAFDSYEQRFPGSLQATNCIFWDGGDEIWNNDNSSIEITYSDVDGSWPGDGNIDDDPMFVDVNGPDGVIGTQDDDVRLLDGSPGIDAGDPCAPASAYNPYQPNAIDFYGDPRVCNDRVDMGADEYYLSYSDFDGDNTVGLRDFCILASAWQTSIGHPDYDDICDLYDDDVIDFRDVCLFAEEWLWLGH